MQPPLSSALSAARSGNKMPNKEAKPVKREASSRKSLDKAASRAAVKEKGSKEVMVIQDQGLFIHATGDSYEGFFEARKKDRSIKMHGPGTYKTAEGDAYTGVWDFDKLGLVEDIEIKYADGARYDGRIKDWMYFNNGRYQYPDGTAIVGEFVDNAPVNKLTLTDPNGHVWLGSAAVGCCWFEPVNHFYNYLQRPQRHGLLPPTPAVAKGKAAKPGKGKK